MPYKDPAKRAECKRKWELANPEKVIARRRKSKAEHPEKIKEYGATYRAKNNDEIKKRHRKWREANPDKIKEWSRKWQIANPEKVKEKDRKNRAAHADRTRENASKYAKAHPEKRRESEQRRRALKRGASVGVVDFEFIWQRDKGICYLCKEPVDATLSKKHSHSLHFDHVVPLAKGGAHSADNIRVAHRRCNLQKSDNLIDVKSVLSWVQSKLI